MIVDMDTDELHSQIAYLEHVIATMPGHVYWKDKHGTYLGCNDAQAKSLGFSSGKSILGKTDYDLPWKDQAALLQSIDQRVMSTQQTDTIEELVTLPDGSVATFLSQKVPLRNKDREIVGIIGISFNITARKELDEVKSQMRQVEERVEAMRAIAGSVAHELRTPLSSIQQGVSGLKHLLPTLLKAYKAAEKAGLVERPIRRAQFAALEQVTDSIDRQVKHANTFINMSLTNLSYAGIEPSSFVPCSMKDIVSATIETYPYQSREATLISFDNRDDFEFLGDPMLTTHVLFNLIKNALFFIHKANKGKIYISFKKETLNNVLVFRDTGKGIPAAQLPHIFDRFYTKRNGGTGLGLAFCKMVIEAYGGTIRCYSAQDKSTEFHLSLPKLYS